MSGLKAYRAAILHFVDEPDKTGDAAWEYFADGLLVIENGYVKALGDYESNYDGDLLVEHYPQHLILPGFIDTHVHYPQTEMIAAAGQQLLGWLDNYTFPTETKFADQSYATESASVFFDELARNGTTTAMVFATVHAASVNAFFEQAQARGLRMISGKVLMDQNAPAELCDTVESAYADSCELIERWHGVDRLLYAVTPRFAPTSSQAQLDMAGKLLNEYEGLYMQTHIAENTAELAWVAELFPEAKNYLDVYDQAGLLGSRSMFAHGIHLCDAECERLSATGSAVSHCPSSNLFLGSGLFNLTKMQQHNVSVSLGSDIGAGTSFSMFRTMDELYKIQQLQNVVVSPMQSLYMATLGGAKALGLESKIGSFKIANEADFTVLDLEATDLMAYRMKHCQSLTEQLSVLQTLGDDRVVAKTFALGRCIYNKGIYDKGIYKKGIYDKADSVKGVGDKSSKQNKTNKKTNE